MKLSCTQENFNQGLFIVSHVASKNTSLPILNNVLIVAKEGSVNLSATNLEVGVSCTVRGKVEKEGDFTVQSRLIADYVSLLPKDRIDLETVNEGAGEALNISCKNHHTKINGQSASDFPLIPKIEKKDAYVINYQDFKQAIGQVVFAVSVSETRPEINGVLFDLSNNTLVMAATDSYRLAEKTVKLSQKSKGSSQQVVVPARALQELQ